jgi:monothiol glutaredoxin
MHLASIGSQSLKQFFSTARSLPALRVFRPLTLTAAAPPAPPLPIARAQSTISLDEIHIPEDVRAGVLADIDEIVKSNRFVLFMKGTKEAPACNFSKLAVTILNFNKIDYLAVDVLANPLFRLLLKDYANWPTIPQFYADGELVGGADLLMELQTSGGLSAALNLD